MTLISTVSSLTACVLQRLFSRVNEGMVYTMVTDKKSEEGKKV
jgi:hypothetical protein